MTYRILILIGCFFVQIVSASVQKSGLSLFHPCISAEIYSEKDDGVLTQIGLIGSGERAVLLTLKRSQFFSSSDKIFQSIDLKKAEVLGKYYEEFSEDIGKGKLQPVMSIETIPNDIGVVINHLRIVFLDMDNPYSKPIVYFFYIWQGGEQIFNLEMTLLGVDKNDGECYALDSMHQIALDVSKATSETRQEK